MAATYRRRTRPHTVVCIPIVVGPDKDKFGKEVYHRGTPVTIPNVAVQPFGIQAFGIHEKEGIANTHYVIFMDPGVWPGGIHSIVQWDGREWDQYGEIKEHRVGRRSRHDVVRIKARSAEVK